MAGPLTEHPVAEVDVFVFETPEGTATENDESHSHARTPSHLVGGNFERKHLWLLVICSGSQKVFLWAM